MSDIKVLQNEVRRLHPLAGNALKATWFCLVLNKGVRINSDSLKRRSKTCADDFDEVIKALAKAIVGV